MLTYKLPDYISTDINGYETISKIYHDLTELDKQPVRIDFKQCRKIDGNLIAAIGAVLEMLDSNGYPITISIPTNASIYNLLREIGFLRAWRIGPQSIDKENYILYNQFYKDSANEFKQYLDEWLMQKSKFPKHTDLAGAKIQESIYEIYVNAKTHGETEYIFSCGEYDSNNFTLDMAIVDCGKTIPTNVNDFLQQHQRPLLSSCDAIKWAFVDGNTTKTDTGGLGLGILKDFISMNKGCLHMVSGDDFLEFKNDVMELNVLPVTFPGTIVNMRFNFNDNKNYFMESERYKLDLNDLL